MRSEESVLIRCASNMAGRANYYRNKRTANAMFWLAQLFYMVDRDADLNHLVRCSGRIRPKPSIVDEIRIKYGNEHLIREDRRVL